MKITLKKTIDLGLILGEIENITSIKDGKILFGTWQGLYLFEHRLNSQSRKIIFHFIGN